MKPSELYIHDAQLIKVIDDSISKELIFEVMLPLIELNEKQYPKRLVFSDAYNYQVFEQAWEGAISLLSIEIIGNDGWRDRVRIDTNAGYRTFFCDNLSVVDRS